MKEDFNYINDSRWKYHHKIAVQSSQIWYAGEFKNMKEEKYFYDLMIEAVRDKLIIEDMYNI